MQLRLSLYLDGFSSIELNHPKYDKEIKVL